MKVYYNKTLFCLLFSLFFSSVYTQYHCIDYTSQDAAAFIYTNAPSGDGSQLQVTILELVINCLAISGQPERYSSVSFTANFTRQNGDVGMAQGDSRCITGNNWDTTGAYDDLSASDFNERINMTMPRQDCFRCLKVTADDPITHCNFCDSNCDQGNRYCTGHTANDCCNYFNNDTCVEQCSVNQSPNGTNFCVCDDFYTGQNCSTCIIECSNGGVANHTSCTCDCQSTGYNGTTCNEDINECTQTGVNPCDNRGTCNNINGGFTCTCIPGYTGRNCSTDINECKEMNPCVNGNCIDEINSYTCQCTPGYTGVNCTVDINECQPNPCHNQGTCMEGINSYNCQCAPGYTGVNCSTNINECTDSRGSPCLNGGACTDTIGSFTCTCQGGWTGELCTVCNISNLCLLPYCNGRDTRCDQCVTGYSVVDGTCVSCSVKDCTTCIAKDNCTTCTNGLTPSDNGSSCTPIIVTEPPTREKSGGGVNTGVIIGVVITFFVLLVIIVIVIAIVIVVLGKINKEKPPTYNVKTPKPEDKDIILTKISNI